MNTPALYDLAVTISVNEGTLWLEHRSQKPVKLVPVSDDEFLLDGGKGASSLVFHRKCRENRDLPLFVGPERDDVLENRSRQMTF
jgi:hypothetical protein